MPCTTTSTSIPTSPTHWSARRRVTSSRRKTSAAWSASAPRASGNTRCPAGAPCATAWACSCGMTASASACIDSVARVITATVREDEVQPDPARLVRRQPHRLDTLAAHRGRPARRPVARPRWTASRWPPTAAAPAPAGSRPSSAWCWAPGTRPSSSSTPGAAFTATTHAAPRPASTRATASPRDPGGRPGGARAGKRWACAPKPGPACKARSRSGNWTSTPNWSTWGTPAAPKPAAPAAATAWNGATAGKPSQGWLLDADLAWTQARLCRYQRSRRPPSRMPLTAWPSSRPACASAAPGRPACSGATSAPHR